MGERPSRRRRGKWVALGLALISAAYIAYALIVSIAAADDAEGLGYVIGFLGGILALAVLIRFIYVRTRPAESRPAFWSPWLLVIAAVLLIVTRAALVD